MKKNNNRLHRKLLNKWPVRNASFTRKERLKKTGSQDEVNAYLILSRKIAASAESSFAPGFADRVMRRLRTDVGHEKIVQYGFGMEMSQTFRPVIAGACVIILLLAVWNLISAGEFSIMGLFGEPEVTVSDAYDPVVVMLWEDAH